jgi:hypothetical protein
VPVDDAKMTNFSSFVMPLALPATAVVEDIGSLPVELCLWARPGENCPRLSKRFEF